MKNVMLLTVGLASLLAGDASAQLIAKSHASPAFHSRCVKFPRCSRRWVPGHFEVRVQEVRAPGHYERVYVDPEYRWVCIGRISVRVKVCDGYYKNVWVEGCARTERIKVWVPGRWTEC